MKNKVKIIIGIVIVVLLVGAGLGGSYLLRVNKYQKAVKNTIINEINLSTISDGTYEGDCDVDFIYAKVKVTVKDGAIDNIDLIEHRNDKGSKAEKIIDDIVKEQKITVDAVSGATNSSKVICRAVENALKKAGK